MTQEQAALIAEAHEVPQTMRDPEERKLLKENNPELLDAYRALLKLAGNP